ncbi:MAG: ion transporter [Rubritepida sp.]|nr:ion transporter [Rubritepida sp.]
MTADGGSMPGRLLHLPYGDAALHWLLGALGLLIFVSEPLRELGLFPAWLQAVCLAAIVLAGLLGLKAPTRLAWPLTLLVAIVLVAQTLNAAGALREWAAGSGLLTAACLALLAMALVKQVFAAGRVTTARIEGAVALYLIVALAFAILYGVVASMLSGAFNLGPDDGLVEILDRRFLYFSLITQTSTGYGDVTPVHGVARSLATLQAVGGQIFTAVLLARLVSLEIMDRRAGD